MCAPTSILELRCRTRHGIYAIPYQSGRPGRPQRLRDGSIVELATPGQCRDIPQRPAPCFEVAVDGGPATIHHANLGLVVGFLPLDGVYVLPSGEVAAVYGADVIPIGEPACSEACEDTK